MKTNHIYHGDNVKVLSAFDSACIDLTVTSPPYDNLRNYKGYCFDFHGVASQLYRVTKDGGVVVWVVGDAVINGSESGTSFRQALHFMDIGFNLHDTMIYQRYGFPKNHQRYEQHFEYMFVLSKGKPKTFNGIRDKPNKHYGEKLSTTSRNKDGMTILSHGTKHGKTVQPFGLRSNIWMYNVGFYNSTIDKIAYKHPAIFPEKLAADHIISWSNPDDIVLDPFAGSGTTLKMAMMHQRQYVGIELSEEYLEIARRRIEYWQSQNPMGL